MYNGTKCDGYLILITQTYVSYQSIINFKEKQCTWIMFCAILNIKEKKNHKNENNYIK